MVWPVMKSEADEANKTASGPISSGRPIRRIGTSRVSRSLIFASANAPAVMGVANQPGAIAFTWTLWRAHSTPSARVSAITPPFGAAAVEDAGEVHVHHEPPVLRGHLDERSHLGDARVVDHDVETSELTPRALDERLDLGVA